AALDRVVPGIMWARGQLVDQNVAVVRPEELDANHADRADRFDGTNHDLAGPPGGSPIDSRWRDNRVADVVALVGFDDRIHRRLAVATARHHNGKLAPEGDERFGKQVQWRRGIGCCGGTGETRDRGLDLIWAVDGDVA